MEKDVTRNIEEQLSAFLDGELPESELQLLVRRLEREPAYRNTLSRYAAIGGVLRGDAPRAVGSGLRGNIMAALDEAQAASPEDFEPVAETTRRPARTGRIAGAAVAASLAVVALVGAYQGGYLQPETVASQPVAAVDARTATVSPVVPVRRATINPDRMTSYLVSHGEFSRAYHGPMVDSRVFVRPARFDEFE